ncbi:putative NAD/NADP octopine/nopaline dehydrogenase [Poronia punctata]|nr:putative NAD/NADP octopine/nopaline dehydrogenase [Poronia punctata]
MITSVTIIGIGSCGCAFAADLLNRGGIKVLLYAHPSHSRNATTLLSSGPGHYLIESIGDIQGRFSPTVVTTDMSVALGFSHTIILAVPAYAQEDILSEIEKQGMDLRRHVFIAASGNLFTLVAARRGRIKARYLVETSASPFASRMFDLAGEGKEGKSLGVGIGVNILGTKKILPISSLPNDMDEKTKRDIGRLFPAELMWCGNVIETALFNFNGVLHPVTTLMNAGWIENTKGDFYFYRQGMTSSVTKLMEEVDKERIAIASEYGGGTKSCLEQMNAYYGLRSETLADFAKESKLHSAMKVCPGDLTHRYISEDLPYVLVPWYELGRKAGKELPVIRSLILWAGMVTGVDYLRTGRNLDRLGLKGWAVEDIVDLVSGGTNNNGNMLVDEELVVGSRFTDPVRKRLPLGEESRGGGGGDRLFAEGGLGASFRAKL